MAARGRLNWIVLEVTSMAVSNEPCRMRTSWKNTNSLYKGRSPDSVGNELPPPQNHARGIRADRRAAVATGSCWATCNQTDGQSIALWKVAQQDPAGLCTFSPSSGPALAHILIVHRHSILTTRSICRLDWVLYGARRRDYPLYPSLVRFNSCSRVIAPPRPDR